MLARPPPSVQSEFQSVRDSVYATARPIIPPADGLPGCVQLHPAEQNKKPEHHG